MRVLPRSGTLAADALAITGRSPDGSVVVSDGVHAAAYAPAQGQRPQSPGIRIVPACVEAAWFTEANVVTLSDGLRTAPCVPVRSC